METNEDLEELWKLFWCSLGQCRRKILEVLLVFVKCVLINRNRHVDVHTLDSFNNASMLLFMFLDLLVIVKVQRISGNRHQTHIDTFEN